MGGICGKMDAVDDLTNRSPWDNWCQQMEKEEDDIGVFCFTPEQYIEFYIKIEEDMKKEIPCKNSNTGNSLLFKKTDARP